MIVHSFFTSLCSVERFYYVNNCVSISLIVRILKLELVVLSIHLNSCISCYILAIRIVWMWQLK